MWPPPSWKLSGRSKDAPTRTAALGSILIARKAGIKDASVPTTSKNAERVPKASRGLAHLLEQRGPGTVQVRLRG
jgi:hypothetical protein